MIKPLGLTLTDYGAQSAVIRHMAAGYDRQGTTLVNTSAVVPFSANSMTTRHAIS